MPKTRIDQPYYVDFWSILDEDGRVDRELEPALPDDLLLKMLRGMLLARRMDERMINLQRQGRIGTFAPIKGMEATQIGAIAAIEDSDWFAPQFREAAAEFWRGRKLESILLFHAGYEEGIDIPESQNNFPISVIVAGQLPYAVGMGYVLKYRKTDRVVMTVMGDGGTSQGDFHEALNFAGVFQAPVVFVCQNNQWAISVPRSQQTRARTLAQKALAYGIPGVQVDGNDVLAVYAAAREAVDRARAGGGPTLIECVTYRVIMHTTSDDPSRYRDEAEVQPWLKRDPLARFQKYLEARGLLSDERLEALEAEVKAEVQAGVEAAEQHMREYTDPFVIFEHQYAEMTPTQREHREELVRELAADAAEGAAHA
jgi:pyruvate dehydrogenase E1 component alpha subunit